MAKNTVITEYDPKKEFLELTVIKREKEPFSPFIMLGVSGSTKLRGLPTMDAYSTTLTFSSTEQWLAKLLMDNRNSANNHCDIRYVNLSQSETFKLKRAYALLRKKDVIRRVRNRVLMFNPLYILPTENRQQAIDTYTALK